MASRASAQLGVQTRRIRLLVTHMNVPKNLELLHKYLQPSQTVLDYDELTNEALVATYTGVSYTNPTKLKLSEILPSRYVSRIQRAIQHRVRYLSLSEPSTIINIHQQMQTHEDYYQAWTALAYVVRRLQNENQEIKICNSNLLKTS